jgi:hypothetical protein
MGLTCWIDVVKMDMPNQNCFLNLKLRWLNKPTLWLNMFFDYTIFTNMLLWQNQHGASSNNNEAFDHLRHWLNLSGHTKYVGWRKHHLYWFTSAIFVGNIHYWLNHAEAIQVQYRLVNLIPMEPIPWMKKGPPFQETSIFIMEFMKSMMG